MLAYIDCVLGLLDYACGMLYALYSSVGTFRINFVCSGSRKACFFLVATIAWVESLRVVWVRISYKMD